MQLNFKTKYQIKLIIQNGKTIFVPQKSVLNFPFSNFYLPGTSERIAFSKYETANEFIHQKALDNLNAKEDVKKIHKVDIKMSDLRNTRKRNLKKEKAENEKIVANWETLRGAMVLPRGNGFKRKKIIRISTPTTSGDMFKAFDESFKKGLHSPERMSRPKFFDVENMIMDYNDLSEGYTADLPDNSGTITKLNGRLVVYPFGDKSAAYFLSTSNEKTPPPQSTEIDGDVYGEMIDSMAKPRTVNCQKNRAPMVHQLKIKPVYFMAITSRKKTFEIRKNDRHYMVGDTVILREYSEKGNYTGYTIKVKIKYVTDYLQMKNHVVFGFDLIEMQDEKTGTKKNES